MNRLLFTAAVVCALLASCGVASADVVLYRECFGNNNVGPTNYRDPADYGWACYYGGFGLPAEAWTGTEDPVPLHRHLVTNEPGRPQDLDNVSAGASDSQTHGFYAYGDAWPYNADRMLIFTEEFTVERSTYLVTSISWRQGNDNDIDLAENRVVVRIGGAWYATSAVFTNEDVPEGEFGTHANVVHHTLAFSADATAWRPLVFMPGTDFRLTAAEQLDADLPSGDITAFGFYIWQKGANYGAIDTYQIDGATIPEPATAALVALGLAALLRRRPFIVAARGLGATAAPSAAVRRWMCPVAVC